MADCWVPDYCDPEKFQYKLCKLRLRGRAKPGTLFRKWRVSTGISKHVSEPQTTVEGM